MDYMGHDIDFDRMYRIFQHLLMFITLYLVL